MLTNRVPQARISRRSIINLNDNITPNSSPRRSARLNPPPTPEQESLAAQKKGFVVFATPLSILDRSPSRKTRSPTRSSTSPRALKPAAGRATKTSPRRMHRGYGRETSVLGVIDSSKKRGRTEDEDDERELDEGPRVKRTRREDVVVEDHSFIEGRLHIPTLRVGSVDSFTSEGTTSLSIESAVSQCADSTETAWFQESRSARDVPATLPFIWEADIKEENNPDTWESLRTLYEDFYWSQEVHKMYRTRADDAEALKQAHARLRTTQTKWDQKISELVLAGQCFLLKEVFSSQDPILFELD
ncbi:hypothetical protein FRC14_001880 [Serendipita sp. 396]|nr:hypothetical protein FRC14_001880 [Serendipita sp. 396]KAG8773674.1 hypothetical protein FRC15_001869 [Serendipita sp. 397]KAG8855634.1 hypothetical protein FRC20_000727 [Serendipita sp. 405]